MRAISFRRKAPSASFARIIVSSSDSHLDRFIPLEEAEKLFEEGKLAKVDLGNDYPNSYQRKA